LLAFGFTTAFDAIIYLTGISGIRAQTGSILVLVETISGIFFDSTVLKKPSIFRPIWDVSSFSQQNTLKQTGTRIVTE
jgi:hypothetical protein